MSCEEAESLSKFEVRVGWCSCAPYDKRLDPRQSLYLASSCLLHYANQKDDHEEQLCPLEGDLDSKTNTTLTV